MPVSGGAWGWLWAFVGVHADLGTQGSGLARFGREEGRDLTCLGPLCAQRPRGHAGTTELVRRFRVVRAGSGGQVYSSALLAL